MKNFTTLLLLLMAVVFGTNTAKAEETTYDYVFNATVLCQADWYGTRFGKRNHRCLRPQWTQSFCKCQGFENCQIQERQCKQATCKVNYN